MFFNIKSMFKCKPRAELRFWSKTREAQRLGVPCNVTEEEIREALKQEDPTSENVPLLESLLPRVEYRIVKE